MFDIDVVFDDLKPGVQCIENTNELAKYKSSKQKYCSSEFLYQYVFISLIVGILNLPLFLFTWPVQ